MAYFQSSNLVVIANLAALGDLGTADKIAAEAVGKIVGADLETVVQYFEALAVADHFPTNFHHLNFVELLELVDYLSNVLDLPEAALSQSSLVDS